MPAKEPQASKKQPKRYFQNASRRIVYGILGVAALVAVALYLFVPHYIPQNVATPQQIADAHHDIINKYFLASTTCAHDTLSATERVKSFNTYLQVNQYANRAVIRGCNNKDQLLAKTNGAWQALFALNLDTPQDSDLQKACLIDDITVSAKNAHTADELLAEHIDTCNALLKTSYIKL